MDLDDDTPKEPKVEHKEIKHVLHPTPQTVAISKSTFLYIIAVVMLIIGLSAGYVLGDKFGGIFGKEGGTPTQIVPNDTAPAERIAMVLDGTDPVLGDAKAPLTMIEFSDFQCPYCSRFAMQIESQIITDYVDTGKLKIVFRDFPLGFHENALPAAIAAECANKQGKFWEFHDLLFANQDTLGTENYDVWAKELSLDMNKFNTCQTLNETAAKVMQDQSDGANIGIQGTPTMLIGTEKDGYVMIVGARPYEVFKQAIDAELA